MADATHSQGVYRQTGGNRFVVASSGSCDVESGGEIDIESGGAFKLAGTNAVTALTAVNSVGLTTAELVYLDAVTAGTVAVGKAVVVSSTKKAVDALAILELTVGAGTSDGVQLTSGDVTQIDGVTAGTVAVGKAVVAASTKKGVDHLAILNLYVGAGTSDGVALTSGDANLIDGLTAGTVAASKAVVVDSSKAIDIIALNAVAIGPNTSSSYAVTATALEVNLLDNQPASAAYTISDATSYAKNADIQLYDAAGAAIDGRFFVRLVLLADSAGAAFLTPTSAQTLSTGTNVAATDVVVPTTAHPEIAYGITSTSGLLSVKWSDTGETVTWAAVVFPNGSWDISSAAITTTSS